MKVFVVGHRGMLGHVVARFLAESGCLVVTSNQRYSPLPENPLIEEVRASGCEWVVNVLGKIKQKCHEPGALFESNSLFPMHLRMRLRSDQRLIHASTDCVFSGQTGNYSVESAPDPVDEYGLSKMLGESVAEAGRAIVVRTSIIGPELSRGAGLMSWFLQQQGPVKGYLNHIWNGVTTLEWAKVCLELIKGQQDSRTSLWQVGVWPPVSKFELLEMIGNSWDHKVHIEPTNTQVGVDRSLKPTWQRRALPEQLHELKQWYLSDCSP
jgi:dTDP-4-dehydrorhamnose reductase